VSIKDFVGGARLADLARVAKSGLLQELDNEATLWEPAWIESFARWEKPLGGAHVIVLFSDSPAVVGEEHGAEIVFDFANEVALQPGIYLVGRSVSSHAWRLPDSGSDFQRDFKRLISLGLQNTSLMILGRKAGHLVLFVGDVGNPRICITVPLSLAGGLTEQQLLDALEDFEAECRSGEFRRKIWEDSTNWVPKEEAEKIVQNDLYLWFRARFRKFSTLAEVGVSIGRADLFLIPLDQDCAVRAVVELKVARGLTSNGQPVSAASEVKRILSGRIQVSAYGTMFGAAIRLLCAYDLRRTKDPAFFVPIATACAQENVTFRSYKILNDGKSAQIALVNPSQTN
jgi:hypothetical protein